MLIIYAFFCRKYIQTSDYPVPTKIRFQEKSQIHEITINDFKNQPEEVIRKIFIKFQSQNRLISGLRKTIQRIKQTNQKMAKSNKYLKEVIKDLKLKKDVAGVEFLKVFNQFFQNPRLFITKSKVYH